MKKIIIAASIALLCAACGGDDNTLNPIPSDPSTEQNTIEITTDDIVKFLNLDKQQNVYEATEKAKSELGRKTIHGKELNVTAVDVVRSDEEKGTFTLKVTGNSSEKTFVKEVNFEGFGQRPTDYEMATRVVATWKKDVDYQREFDFDRLYRLHDNSKFTAAYLQKFIDLSSSNVDGNRHYTFTPTDWTKTTISDVRYIGGSSSGSIAFTVTYNGKKSNTGNGSSNASPSVPFDKNLYYRNQVSVNTEAVSKLYMRGVYEHAILFYASLLRYDSEKFVPYIKDKHHEDGTNTLLLTINLVAKDGHDTDLADFELQITDFKSVSTLDNSLTISSTMAVGQFFSKYFRSKSDGDYTAAVKQFDARTWLKNVEMWVARDGEQVDQQASQVPSEDGNYNVTAWLPTDSRGKNLDIYLLEPRIDVLSAKKTDNFIYITYKIVYANNVSIDGKERTLRVHLVADSRQ